MKTFFSNLPGQTRNRLMTAFLLVGFASPLFAQAADLPGQGITVIPAQTTLAEETFQTMIVMRGLEQLGYKVGPVQELNSPVIYQAAASGDVTFAANYWSPQHDDMYRNAGGDAKLWSNNDFSPNALQGYLIDKKTADQYHITNIAQMKDPAIARLFDIDGDGKADLTGCNPGWGCEAVVEHQLDAYGLRGTVTHVQGEYSTLIADTITRFRLGKPVFYYTWTPNWVSNVLVPGKDVTWLEVPFSSLPGSQSRIDTKLANGKNYGWVVNTQRIVANRAFIEANPAARVLFSEMQVPIGDINAQNLAMEDGANKPADIERHVNGWIKAHQQQWDQWINDALAAAR